MDAIVGWSESVGELDYGYARLVRLFQHCRRGQKRNTSQTRGIDQQRFVPIGSFKEGVGLDCTPSQKKRVFHRFRQMECPEPQEYHIRRIRHSQSPCAVF